MKTVSIFKKMPRQLIVLAPAMLAATTGFAQEKPLSAKTFGSESLVRLSAGQNVEKDHIQAFGTLQDGTRVLGAELKQSVLTTNVGVNAERFAIVGGGALGNRVKVLGHGAVSAGLGPQRVGTELYQLQDLQASREDQTARVSGWSPTFNSDVEVGVGAGATISRGSRFMPFVMGRIARSSTSASGILRPAADLTTDMSLEAGGLWDFGSKMTTLTLTTGQHSERDFLDFSPQAPQALIPFSEIGVHGMLISKKLQLNAEAATGLQDNAQYTQNDYLRLKARARYQAGGIGLTAQAIYNQQRSKDLTDILNNGSPVYGSVSTQRNAWGVKVGAEVPTAGLVRALRGAAKGE